MTMRQRRVQARCYYTQITRRGRPKTTQMWEEDGILLDQIKSSPENEEDTTPEQNRCLLDGREWYAVLALRTQRFYPLKWTIHPSEVVGCYRLEMVFSSQYAEHYRFCVPNLALQPDPCTTLTEAIRSIEREQRKEHLGLLTQRGEDMLKQLFSIHLSRDPLELRFDDEHGELIIRYQPSPYIGIRKSRVLPDPRETEALKEKGAHR